MPGRSLKSSPLGPPNSSRRLAIQRRSAAPCTRKIFPSATTSNTVATVGTGMREGSIAACLLFAVTTYKCAASNVLSARTSMLCRTP
jgi:hypothetical protein